MMYYLITKEYEYSICLVKVSGTEHFLDQWADKIIDCSRHIMELLPGIRLKYKGEYSFSDN